MNEEMTPDAVIQKIWLEIDELKLEHMFETEPNKRYFIQKKIDELKQRLKTEFDVDYADIEK